MKKPVIPPVGSKAVQQEANGVRPSAADKLRAAMDRDRAMSAAILRSEAQQQAETADLANDPANDELAEKLALTGRRLAAQRDDQVRFRKSVLPAAEAAALTEERAARQAELWRLYAEAQGDIAEEAERIKADYGRAAAILTELIRRAGEFGSRIAALNADLPDGAAELRHPEEMVRDRPSRPREELTREVVELWVNVDDPDRPLPGSQLSAVRDHGDGTGSLVVAQQQIRRLRRRKFAKVTFLPEVRFARGYRLADLVLPGLRPDEPFFWASERRTPGGWLVEDKGCEALPRPRAEFLPVPEGSAGLGSGSRGTPPVDPRPSGLMVEVLAPEDGAPR